MNYSTIYESPIGLLTLVSDGSSLIGLWIKGQKYFANTIKGTLVSNDELPIFEMARNWLDRYFGGEKISISQLPLAPHGSDFQKHVWHILCQIPYGEVMSYKDIAQKVSLDLGRDSMSSRAVGGAVGHNPISIIIPCHRVVGANGSLTGYSAGIDKKVEIGRAHV